MQEMTTAERADLAMRVLELAKRTEDRAGTELREAAIATLTAALGVADPSAAGRYHCVDSPSGALPRADILVETANGPRLMHLEGQGLDNWCRDHFAKRGLVLVAVDNTAGLTHEATFAPSAFADEMRERGGLNTAAEVIARLKTITLTPAEASEIKSFVDQRVRYSGDKPHFGRPTIIPPVDETQGLWVAINWCKRCGKNIRRQAGGEFLAKEMLADALATHECGIDRGERVQHRTIIPERAAHAALLAEEMHHSFASRVAALEPGGYVNPEGPNYRALFEVIAGGIVDCVDTAFAPVKHIR